MTDPVRVPGLLDVVVEPPFIRSREVEDLAEDVIASFDEFEPIRTSVADAGLSIEYVFETRPFDPAKDEFKTHVIAKVTKAPPLWSSLTGHHLVVQFRRWFWERFDDEQRRAVLHHELSHVEVDEPDDHGRIPVSLRPHDVEDFAQTMLRFGPVIPGRSRFIKAYALWAAEHPDAAITSGTEVRPAEVEAEAFGHRVAEAMMDAAERASDPSAHGAAVDAARSLLTPIDGTSVSITYNGRTVASDGREVDPETGEILDVDNVAWVGSARGQAALERHARRRRDPAVES